MSIRLSLIGKKVSADAAHDLLQALLPQDARVIYNFHKGATVAWTAHLRLRAPALQQMPYNGPLRLLSHDGETTITMSSWLMKLN